MMSAAATIQNIDRVSEKYKEFCLFGGFAGDDELFQEIEWCREEVAKTTKDDLLSEGSFGRLLGLFEKLPARGRSALTTKILGTSPIRDHLLERLFDHCVLRDGNSDSEEIEDDFVVLLADSTLLMDTSKYNVLSATVMLLPFCTPAVAADVSRRYLASASTRYQSNFLCWAAKQSQDVFSNDELWKFFQDSPGKVQQDVLVSLQQMVTMPTGTSLQSNPPHPREAFLIRVLEAGSHDTELIFHCSSDYLESKLDHSLLQEAGFRRWRAHGDLYLKYIQNQLKAETNPLMRGKLWKEKLQPALGKAPKGDLESQHIKAIQNLLKECNLLAFASPSTSRLPQNVRVHLETLAQKGQDISRHEGIQGVQLPENYLSIIPKNERIQTAQQAIKSVDWATFEQYKNGVGLQNLPFADKFNSWGVTELWDVISGRLQNARAKTDSQQFLLYFATADFTNNNLRSFTIDTLWDWNEWHLRSTPDKLSKEQIVKYARAAGGVHEEDLEEETTQEVALERLWRLWYQSLTSRYFDNGLVTLTTNRVLKAASEHRPQVRSKITLDARYGHELLNIARKGMNALPSSTMVVVENEHLLERLRTLLGLLGTLNFHNPLPVVDDLNQAMGQVALHEFIPRLADVLRFDPKDTKQYISNHKLSQFTTWASWLANKSSTGGPIINALISQVLTKVLRDATADDCHVSLPNGQTRFETVIMEEDSNEESGEGQNKGVKFVYYQSNLHREAVQSTQRILRDILRETTKYSIHDRAEEKVAAWTMLVECQDKLNNNKEEVDQHGTYLAECALYLPPSSKLLEKEKPKILQSTAMFAAYWKERTASSENTNKNMFYSHMTQTANQLHKLGLLQEALQLDVFDEEDRKALLLKTNSFLYEEVRESLKEATIGVDGEKRAAGHNTWLQRAIVTVQESSSLSHYETAVQYTAGRIRNEAGLYRRSLFDTVAENLGVVIGRSLTFPSEGNIKASKGITETLVLMLQNDLARRDSIGRLGHFKDLSGVVIRRVLAHNDARSTKKQPKEDGERRKAVMQLWISFAIQIHWLQTQAGAGESGLMTYRWPAQQTWKLKSSSLIPSNVFDEAYPRPESSNAIAGIRRNGLNLVDMVVDNLNESFSPRECVECLDNALREVWDPTFPCEALSWQEDSWMPEKDDIRKALSDRLVALFCICGVAWEEVPQLTTTFDRTFDNLQEAPEHHYRFAVDLLRNVLDLYEARWSLEDSFYFEIPRLAGAVSSVFEYAVKKNLTSDINEWFPIYCKQSCTVGTVVDRAKAPQHARFLSFLAKYGYKRGCVPPACRKTVDKTSIANRQAGLAKLLLDMSPSAILKKPVQEALETERQDIMNSVLHPIEEGGGIIEGPFAKEGSPISPERLIYDWLKPSSLSAFSFSITKRYADYALSKASDSNSSVSARVEAIENFVACPSTGYQAVVSALQEEDLAGPIREAIIVKVFSLDSPWHVVSHLLNSSLNNKQQQRMTASLLGHISKYVQQDKVIKLLGMLLDDSKRSNLGMSLHKAIIRMLFDNRTPEATILLQREWEHDLPMGIRLVLVEKCISIIVTCVPSQAEFEWGLLESLTTKKDSPKQLIAPLLKPSSIHYSAGQLFPLMDNLQGEDALAQEHLSGRGTGGSISVSDETIREKYYNLLRTLEDTLDTKSWKMIVKAYRLTFSVPGPDMQVDVVAVEEMKTLLTAEQGNTWDESDQFVTRTVSRIFSRTCTLSLSKDWKENPTKESDSICNDNTSSQQLRECVRILLDRILDLPLRQVKQRELLVLALSNIVREVNSSSCIRGDLSDSLLNKRFKDELSLVHKEASGLLRSVGKN